ncbi:MAG TPA: class I SAM-dependent methyltransferase [Verrucomicrobiae bacterium]|nr:class I SAM-dependent methyltransferase [Verrucomicrobiae bacterium]
MNLHFPAGLRLARLCKTIWAELTFPQSCAPGHYYSPIPARAELERDAARIFSKQAAALPEIDLNERAQLELLGRLAAQVARLGWPPAPAGGARYRPENDYFPAADGVLLAGMLLAHRPARYVEIGSGFSSALALDVAEAGLEGQLACTFIDPSPGRLRSLLRAGDLDRAQVLRQRVQDVPDALFRSLAPRDILFVDSSHVAKAGSDLCDILFRVLPLLPPGVLIHFHDVTWPFEYRRQDVLRGRSWNEAYLLRAFLANNCAYTIRLFASWLEQCHPAGWRAAFPYSAASSLWLEKIC